MHQYYVYILASRSRTLYVGVTNDLRRRVWEHRSRANPGFTSRYRIDRLVYCEDFPDVLQAIAAEKLIKGWRREKKVALIASVNPNWQDLSEGWYGNGAVVREPQAPAGNADPSLRSG